MNTKLLKLINETDFEKLFQHYGYAFFTRGQYNLNIIGIRNTIDLSVNTFNDVLLVIYKDNDNKWIYKKYDFTTDPGLTTLNAPINSKGTSILHEGQYRNTYKIDLHKNKYKALCQRLAPVCVYRDNDRNNKISFNQLNVDVGYFGINIHYAKDGTISELVNGYSAGCQVFKDSQDFNEFMKLCDKSSKIFGNSFTYTLINSEMLAQYPYL